MLIDDLLAFERRGWDSLCAGTGAEFYGALMTAEGVMILSHGFMLGRDAVVASLRDAEPWQDYDISDASLIELDADNAILLYTGTASRSGGQPEFRALMASTYTRRRGDWRLALYQQTPMSAQS